MNVNNLLSLNSQSQMRMNQLQLQKSLTKLASGYRVNSAADDAAGLAISEKMRASMTATERAMSNAQDGKSLVGVAEGAMNEVHSMLNRVNELAMQASNGILDDDQRASLNNEAQQLMQEIDRISQATNFNGITLLDGSLMTEQQIQVSNNLSASHIADSVYLDQNSMQVFDGTNASSAAFSVNGSQFVLADAANYNDALAAFEGSGVNVIQVDGTSGAGLTAGDMGTIASAVNSAAGTNFTAASGGIAMSVGEGLKLQVGDTGDGYNTITVGVANMSSNGLGLSGLDLSTQGGASSALSTIRGAVNRVSSGRGDLGATENRLSSTINNLAVSHENTMAAESRIRDADMARTMMNLVKSNVLSQTGMAMQSHSQMNAAQVLNLLR